MSSYFEKRAGELVTFFMERGYRKAYVEGQIDGYQSFRTQTIHTHIRLITYPTLWTIRTQQIMTQNVQNKHKHLLYLSNRKNANL